MRTKLNLKNVKLEVKSYRKHLKIALLVLQLSIIST